MGTKSMRFVCERFKSWGTTMIFTHIFQGDRNPEGGGYSHIYGIRGCAALASHFFAKNSKYGVGLRAGESLNMGPVYPRDRNARS